MTVRGYFRGHEAVWDPDEETWRYADDGAPAPGWSGGQERPCPSCGELVAAGGPDPCLGRLPGVSSACCGHGRAEEAAIVFEDGTVITGFTVQASEPGQ